MEQKIKSTLSTLSTFKKSGAKINPLYPLLGKVIRSEEQKINPLFLKSKKLNLLFLKSKKLNILFLKSKKLNPL